MTAKAKKQPNFRILKLGDSLLEAVIDENCMHLRLCRLAERKSTFPEWTHWSNYADAEAPYRSEATLARCQQLSHKQTCF